MRWKMKIPDPIAYGLCRNCLAILPKNLSGTPCPNCGGDPYSFPDGGYTREEIVALKTFIKVAKQGQPQSSRQEEAN